jgi:peptidoglycan-N-acetylmuramic acid deacetylase
VQTVTENLHCGAILLLHAVSKDNAQGLDEMITKCQMLGYSFGNPEELAQ